MLFWVLCYMKQFNLLAPKTDWHLISRLSLTCEILRTNQIKKILISKNNDYFIHTEIHSVKDYRSCLWLDERCIFIVVCFQTLNWDVKKSQYIWNKIRTDWASVKYLVYTECSVLNDILIIYIWTQIHTDWNEIYTDSLVHCARSFVCFFMVCNL